MDEHLSGEEVKIREMYLRSVKLYSDRHDAEMTGFGSWAKLTPCNCIGVRIKANTHAGMTWGSRSIDVTQDGCLALQVIEAVEDDCENRGTIT